MEFNPLISDIPISEYPASLVCLSLKCSRVKSGNFGLQVNWDSDLVCFVFQLLE